MELTALARFAGALIVVLGLIGLCAYAARRFGVIPTARPGRRQTRLGIVEALSLDGKRRLVLIRRDECEHLLLLGPTGDLLVEARAAEAPTPTNETSPDSPARPETTA